MRRVVRGNYIAHEEKLAMDLRRKLPLGVRMDEERADLISRIFALLTAKFEDGAGEAINGQGRSKDLETLERLANQIQSTGEEITVVAEAARALIAVRA